MPLMGISSEAGGCGRVLADDDGGQKAILATGGREVSSVRLVDIVVIVTGRVPLVLTL